MEGDKDEAEQVVKAQERKQAADAGRVKMKLNNIWLLTLALFFLVLLVSGCAVKATKEGNTMILRGYGAEGAKWADGSEITKRETVRIPEIMLSGDNK